MTGPAQRFRLLNFVLRAVRYGMMHITCFTHEVCYRQLQAVRVAALRFGLGRQRKTRPQVLQDVRRVRDDQLARLEQRRNGGCLWDASCSMRVHERQEQDGLTNT